MEEKSAQLIQNAYRNRNARNQMKKLKAEKIQLKEEKGEPKAEKEEPKSKKENPQTIVINQSKKEKTKKPNKPKVPSKLKKQSKKATPDQEYRMYLNYTKPMLDKYNIENPNNDIVNAIKDAFGQDNKETLIENTTFSYENPVVIQQMKNELFDTETRLEQGRNAVEDVKLNAAARKIQENYKVGRLKKDYAVLKKYASIEGDSSPYIVQPNSKSRFSLDFDISESKFQRVEEKKQEEIDRNRKILEKGREIYKRSNRGRPNKKLTIDAEKRQLKTTPIKKQNLTLDQRLTPPKTIRTKLPTSKLPTKPSRMDSVD